MVGEIVNFGVDTIPALCHPCDVQLAKVRPCIACLTDDILESLVHPAHRRLNICNNMRSHGVGPQGILPRRFNHRSGPISFASLNRVTTGNRVRRAAGEGLAQGATDRPTLLNDGAPVATHGQSARCNSGPREKASVGMADQCARLFKSEATDRPGLITPNANRLPAVAWGWFCSLPPSHA